MIGIESVFESIKEYLPYVLFIIITLLLVEFVVMSYALSKLARQSKRRFNEVEFTDDKTETEERNEDKGYMEFKCRHCGYATQSWEEVEGKTCPSCGKNPSWVSVSMDPSEELEESELLGGLHLKATEDIKVPEMLVDRVIGQDHAVNIIKKAALQRRHVMMIGDPGTGKSMLGLAMSELLPKEETEDILVYPNPEDENNPKIRITQSGEGKKIEQSYKEEEKSREWSKNIIFVLFAIGIAGYAAIQGQLLWGLIAVFLLFLVMRWMMPKTKASVPKLLMSNADKKHAPFVDATGAHAGALLGDVRHDPYQSGGLGTPPHERVESGDIHRAHKGVLYIDEINTLRVDTQQNLLTALQEKKYPITGQSERSAGALVKTEPVPCDFIMICAGNLGAMRGMHPALRSRIRGYGYEVYLSNEMDDTAENRRKLVRFIAQEVEKDGKIPHFDASGVAEIINEARRRAERKNKLMLILRDLGGLVRVAGDIARAEGSGFTTKEHVLKAKKMSQSVEQQVADRYLERKKDYRMFKTDGIQIGRVNGLAVVGDSGIVLPIIAEVTPAQSKEEGKVIATGRLQEIAREAVQNVSAIFKKITGKDISNKDVHIQFVGTYEGVEGDSASISVATAVASALENIPVDQSVAMTGSLSVRGDVLPVGGVTHKIEAAASAGIKKVLVPKQNIDDVMIEDKYRDMVEIIPVGNIEDVFKHSLIGMKKKSLIDKIERFLPSPRVDASATVT